MKKVLFAGLICLLLACDSGEYYKKYEDIAQVQWQKTQAISFEVNVNDTLSPLDWIVSLRHTSSMQYGDLKILVEALSPSGKAVAQEYVLPIRDRKTGELLGSAMGDVCDTDNTIENNFVFGETGKYIFRISHAYPDALPVLEVGFILRKEKP